jgi:hypothetical protein
VFGASQFGLDLAVFVEEALAEGFERGEQALVVLEAPGVELGT